MKHKSIMFIALGKIAHWLFYASIILLSACNNPVSGKQCNLYGEVHLDGSDNHAGITVSLYDLSPSSELTEGFIETSELIVFRLDQKHLFDHRRAVPVIEATTDDLGRFSLVVPRGIYNIVVYKDGYSLKQLFEVNLSVDEMDIDELLGSSTILAPVVHYEGVYISGLTTWDLSNDIVIDSETHFLEDSRLEILEGAKIHIRPGASIHIHGQLKISASLSKPVEFNVLPDSRFMGPFHSIKIYDTAEVDQGHIDWIIIKNADAGLLISANGIELSNSFLSSESSALQVNNADAITVDNCWLLSSNSSLAYTADFTMCNIVGLRNSIVLGGGYGVRFNVVAEGLIENNLIKGEIWGISLEFDTTANLVYNEILSAGIGVWAYLRTNFSVSRCNITAPKGFDILGAYVNGAISNCNIVSSTTAIRYLAQYSGDMDAIRCYWGTSDLEEIQNLIIDKNDFTPADAHYNRYGYVNYEPTAGNLILDAGLR